MRDLGEGSVVSLNLVFLFVVFGAMWVCECV